MSQLLNERMVKKVIVRLTNIIRPLSTAMIMSRMSVILTRLFRGKPVGLSIPIFSTHFFLHYTG